MPKFFRYLLFLALLYISYPTNAHHTPHSVDYFQKKEHIVYITRTGEKYHRGTCGHLSKSKIEVKLKEAIKNGYTACKNCKP